MATTEPLREGHGGASAMEICTICFELRGRYDKHRQQCRCDREANPEEYETRWLRAGGAPYDFNDDVELCRCCAVALVPSGSRWSPFFCGECKRRVRALNNAFGRWVIPIGRHSMMHGAFLGAVESDEKAEEFALALGGLFERIAHLELASCAVVERNLKTLGLLDEGSLPLSAYLEAAVAYPLTKETAFSNLCAQFGASEPPRADPAAVSARSIGPGDARVDQVGEVV
jgi:hypothetical protein